MFARRAAADDRLGGGRLVEAVGAPPVRAQEREQPADAFVGVDLLDQLDVLAREVELVGEGALDHVKGHDGKRSRSGRREAVPVGVGGGLGAIGAARLAQDAADVVGRRVLADRERLRRSARLLKPRATRPRIWASRGESPSGRPAGGAGDPSARIRASSAGMPIRSASAGRLAEQRLGAGAVSARRASRKRPYSYAVCASQVGAPMRRLSSSARSKCSWRAPGLAERGGEHAQVAVGGAVTGDEVADHHVRAAERLELGVHQRRHALVAERRSTRRSGR